MGTEAQPRSRPRSPPDRRTSPSSKTLPKKTWPAVASGGTCRVAPRHPPRLYRLGGGSWRRGVDSVKRMTVRRVIVDHVLFVVEDLAASRRLYTAALAPLGHEELYVQEDCVSYGPRSWTT